MLKRLLLASTAIMALGTAASAADLPSRRAPAPYVAVPVFTWTGFYIGGNAGYIFGADGRVANGGPLVGVVYPGFTRVDPEGFTGGGQIGYNVQFGNFVAGIEADAQYTDFVRTTTVTLGGGAGTTSNFRTDMAYLGTVRGRLGFAFDRLLVYGTGGFAYGDVDNSATFRAIGTGAGGPVVAFGRRTSMETGWVAGGGIEYAIPNWNWFGSSAVTVKAEALYYDLGRQTVFAGPFVSRFDNNGVIARAGLNFKFGTF